MNQEEMIELKFINEEKFKDCQHFYNWIRGLSFVAKIGVTIVLAKYLTKGLSLTDFKGFIISLIIYATCWLISTFIIKIIRNFSYKDYHKSINYSPEEYQIDLMTKIAIMKIEFHNKRIENERLRNRMKK